MSDFVTKTLQFVQTAMPEPTDRDRQTQLGVHVEELHEFFKELSFLDTTANTYLANVEYYLLKLAKHLKGADEFPIVIKDKIAYLDALCDQQVTAISVANSNNFNIDGALHNVADSNLSKFEDGVVLRDENGKIMKGKDYVSPDLAPYISPIQ